MGSMRGGSFRHSKSEVFYFKEYDMYLNEEDDNVIYSMANRRPYQTGLPVNIWIDEKSSYKNSGHWKRIKFQLNRGLKAYNQPEASMDLSGNVVKDTFNKALSEISINDIKQISNFVKNNSYALEKVADEDIFMDQFDIVMIKGGELASQEQLNEQKNKVDEFIKLNNQQ